jgi:hypothetical protein
VMQQKQCISLAIGYTGEAKNDPVR